MNACKHLYLKHFLDLRKARQVSNVIWFSKHFVAVTVVSVIRNIDSISVVSRSKH